MNEFWNWLSQGQQNVPTLGGRKRISATTTYGDLSITAGNGTLQPLVSQETVFKYVDEYLLNVNTPIEGNKRYVIALYLHWINQNVR